MGPCDAKVPLAPEESSQGRTTRRAPTTGAPTEPCRAITAVLLLSLASSASVLRAQSTNASLTGRVTDPSKAVIVDAKVAAISATTNVLYQTTTNGSGEYYLANLTPGAYRIEIEKPGFRN